MIWIKLNWISFIHISCCLLFVKKTSWYYYLERSFLAIFWWFLYRMLQVTLDRGTHARSHLWVAFDSKAQPHFTTTLRSVSEWLWFCSRCFRSLCGLDPLWLELSKVTFVASFSVTWDKFHSSCKSVQIVQWLI